jgi:hypothetical protein
MTSGQSSLDPIASRHARLLLAVLSAFVLALGVLAWMNIPQTDDYHLQRLLEQFGFGGMQKWVFRNNSGRYATTFMEALWAQGGFLYKYYFFHVMLLLLLHIWASFFFLREWTNRVLGVRPTGMTLLLYALLWLFVMLSILPQVKTDLFWFVSAICYRLPMVLLIFLAGFSLRLKDRFSWPDFILSLLLLVMILGSNELSSLMVGTIVMLAALVYFRKAPGPLNGMKWLVILLIGICMALVFVAGMISNRSEHLPATSLPATLMAFPALVGMSIWNIFRSPLCWFFLLDVFLFFNARVNGLEASSVPARRAAGVCLAVLCLSFLAMVHLTHGSIPLRVLNVFTGFLFACLVLWAAGWSLTWKIAWDPTLLRFFGRYKFLMYALLLFCSMLSSDILQSLYTGYYARKINLLRVEKLKAAKAAGEKVAVLQPYDQVADSLMGQGSRILVRRMAGTRPVLLSIDADLRTERTLHFLCHYYGLDTIRVGELSYEAYAPYR